MKEPPPFEPPARLTEPLTVDILEGEIILDGGLAISMSLTPHAALRTGIALIEAASRMVVYESPEPAPFDENS